MDSTATMQAQAGTALKERDLVAQRYRVAVLYSRDRETEVWRALDETENQVVTLEFLLSNDPATRESFLAAARRMAAVERPAVMKVAAIHEDPGATFIVYQHLVHVPVPLDWLKPKDAPAPIAPAVVMTPPAPAGAIAPAAAAPERPAFIADPAPAPQPIVIAPAAPTRQIVAPPAPGVAAFTATPPVPTFIAPREAADPAPTEPAEEETAESRDHGLVALTDLLRAREFSQIDVALLKEAAAELATVILTELREFDYAALGARAVELFGSALSRRPQISLPTPHLSIPRPQMSTERAPKLPKAPKAPKPVKIREARVAPVKQEKAPRGPSRLHVRWRRVLFRGACLALIATTVAVMPAEAWPRVASDLSAIGAQALPIAGDVAQQAGKIGGEIIDQATKIGGDLKTNVEQRIASASGAPTPLRKATFDVPPLSEYGASLDSKAPDPTARPDQTVEWVVALRNTGSAGWYRGIDGAQASLALSDGTSAGVQSTDFVGPGQIGWFVVKLHAPTKPGTYDIALLPRIDGRGALRDLGIKAKLTVTAP